MGKFKPGIPDSFILDVKPVNDLGDYLDERPAAVAKRAKAPVPSPSSDEPLVFERTLGTGSTAPEVVPAAVVRSASPAPPAVAAAASSAPPRPAAPPVELAVERRPRVKTPRREISMAPEVLRLSDELIDLIRRGSGQRDTTPSEVFHALVLLVSEAQDELDPHAVPKRGRWGTPTARAYPHELKNAFLRAILRRHTAGECGPGSIE